MAAELEYRVVVVDTDGRPTSSNTTVDEQHARELLASTLAAAPEGMEWTVRLQQRDTAPAQWQDITPVPGQRDPARIARIAEKFARAWSFYPDMRAGQLMVNITERPDPFYVTDEKLEQALDDFLADPPYITDRLAGAVVYLPRPDRRES